MGFISDELRDKEAQRSQREAQEYQLTIARYSDPEYLAEIVALVKGRVVEIYNQEWRHGQPIHEVEVQLGDEPPYECRELLLEPLRSAEAAVSSIDFGQHQSSGKTLLIVKFDPPLS